MRVITLVIITILLAHTNSYADFQEETIRICEDGAGWPPYHYEVVDKKSNQLVAKGYGIDVINRIFGKYGLNYSIEFIPWKRCLNLLQEGKSYHMALSGSYNRQRDENFYLVTWYKTEKYYFYSKKRFPKGLTISQLADLGKYQLGGILGYSYDYLGDLEKRIDKGTKDFDALLAKLDRGRIDLFVDQYEVLAGFAILNKNYLDHPDLGFNKIPGLEPTWFNMMISKKYQHALLLKRILSEGIAELMWTGKHKDLLKKYGLPAH